VAVYYCWLYLLLLALAFALQDAAAGQKDTFCYCLGTCSILETFPLRPNLAGCVGCAAVAAFAPGVIYPCWDQLFDLAWLA